MTGRLLRFKVGKSRQDTDSLLRYLVRSAHASVPFYRRTWDTAGVSVSQFRGVEDLPLRRSSHQGFSAFARPARPP